MDDIIGNKPVRTTNVPSVSLHHVRLRVYIRDLSLSVRFPLLASTLSSEIGTRDGDHFFSVFYLNAHLVDAASGM